jgi:hypothetical protein
VDNTYAIGPFTITYLGDMDGDRDLDIFDMVSMVALCGIKYPDPRYNQLGDLDLDGDVDIFDIVVATGNYGERW